jgi:hypothetical protein
MKVRYFLLIYFLMLLCIANAWGKSKPDDGAVFGYRFGIGGGMGISAVSISALVSYLNLREGFALQERIPEFNSAVEFFASFDWYLQTDIAFGFEYSYLFGSHNFSGTFGSNDYSYSFHMPIILGHYLVRGPGYFFKFGGGLGYFMTRYREDLMELTEPVVYKGGGVGGKFHAVGHTPFGDNLYGYVGAEVRFAFPGSVSDSEGQVLSSGPNDVSMNFISLGLKFGLTYNF